METDLISKLPVREHVKNMRSILRVVTEMDRTYFLWTCVVHIINVAIPYLELILSAFVLDSLVEKRSFQEIFCVVLVTVAFIFAIHTVASMIWNRMEVRSEKMYNIYNCNIQTKMLHMDFSRIDSPEVRELQQRIQTDQNWGAGLYSVFWNVNDILHGSFNIIGALIVGAPVVGIIIKSREYGAVIIFGILLLLVAASMKCRAYFTGKVNQLMFGKWKEEEKPEKFSFSWQFAYEEGFSYKNGKDVRIYDGIPLLERWTTGVHKHKKFREELKSGAAGSAGQEASSDAAYACMSGFAYLIVAFVAIAGRVSAGNVVKLAGVLNRIFSAVYALISGLQEFALTARKHMSTLELIGLTDEMYKGKLPMEKRSDNEYQIEFEDVSFKYPGSEQYALRHFSMKLKIGEKLAIVGMNGSGKTTMIKLLCRLYDPQEGEIRINGVDIRKYRQDEYSRLFSVVFQDYQLFPFVLAQNVAVDMNPERDKVLKCLRDADLGDRVKTLPAGMETYLYKSYSDDGVEISGGEAQKIAIARAIYKESPFILLDEPTAALDPLAEYEIYTNFDKIIGTKTAIYISHRLSSCKFCERIAVFHEGSLVQTGSHEELLRDKSGKYYEMWNAQAQYYQGNECLLA